jgi:hypothetical protein
MINTEERVRELVGQGNRLVLLKPPTTLDTTFAIIGQMGLIDYVDIGCANKCLDSELPSDKAMKRAQGKFWGLSIRPSKVPANVEKAWCMVM